MERVGANSADKSLNYPKDYSVFGKMQVFNDPAFRRSGTTSKAHDPQPYRQHRSSIEAAKLYQDCK